ncbi:hypothetical protein Sme01_15410 [Sphaerisporangium melleum]|uniref:DUF6879 domain-containing protein n=1 Tax=Sphaerisporangium melleum TaxID=321316 RepID=A0A917RKT4_9ACTN|nr:DUF6879 family protein [Sphaerisporangium melleum]GGL11134.1 hypothetical protein GCM10007964_61640 [Sphaerisporangium melleum]GII69065.1 hypothetical protein Sme01_15410 [Sphaerisporangium melleum]
MDLFHRLQSATGHPLPVAAYQREFDAVFESALDTMWKLERAQEFTEPDVESWRAMVDGDWDRSLALLEDRYAPLAAMYEKMPEFRRLRIVETPVTPYLQWEMHFLAIRARAGERIRVLPAEAVHDLEAEAPLPELVIFSRSLCYEVLYDRTGLHTGARRVTDPEVIGPCLSALAGLYEQAEDVAGYHAREIAPLPPPRSP